MSTAAEKKTKSIGINSSFYTYNLYPLYYNFFNHLGLDVILADEYDSEGLSREMTSFCYPMQLSLGMFHNLLSKNPDYIFSPAVFELYAEKDEPQRLDFNCACAFVTGEPFALKQAYKDYSLNGRMLTPNLNFSNGYDKNEKIFINLAKQLGINDIKHIQDAYNYAISMQNAFQEELYSAGSEFINDLKNKPNEYAMVILGRSYNSFNSFANKGIPRKFASRGVHVLPLDMIDIRDKANHDRMYWEAGNRILKVAEIIKNNSQLFATYITNFSCAPDSMILNTFREIMGDKPSLTLELDSHSADAGINTRIDAAIDIINNYRHINEKIFINTDDFAPARLEFTEPVAMYISSDGERIPINDERVLVLIPAMGELTNTMFASAFRSCGIAAHALHEHDANVMKLGRKNASGKECLPIILMAGSLLDYMENEWDRQKHLIYFQVQGAGNCRLGQYPVFMDQMLRNNKLRNVTQMVLMNEDGFAGLGNDWAVRAAQALIIGDVTDDIRSGIMTYAIDKIEGMRIFNDEFAKLNEQFVNNPKDIYRHLEKFALSIRQNIPKSVPLEEFKSIALIGEIFCRRDTFAHRWLNKYFADKGFVLKTSYISEWISYVDYLISIDLLESDKSITKRFERMLRNFFMKDVEKKVKKNLEKSGYYKFERMNIEPILKHSKHIIPLEYKGEPGLTLGIAMNNALEDYCGIINFGPFGCMPTRFAEAVSTPEMKVRHKVAAKRMYDTKYRLAGDFDEEMDIPFLTIETDGNPYSQLIESRLEAFILQAERCWQLMKNNIL